MKQIVITMMMILFSPHAISESCNEITDWEEQISCLNESLDSAKNKVDGAYTRMINSLEEDARSDDKPTVNRAKELLALEVKSQKLWSTYKDHLCNDVLEVVHKGGSFASQSQMLCEIQLYKERLEWLSNY